MATSNLTVRTLALASVALVLACVHAARGDGASKFRSSAAAKPTGAPVGTLGGRSSHPGVATVTGGSAGRASAVATFSGQKGPAGGGMSRPPTRAGAAPAAARQAVAQAPGTTTPGPRVAPAAASVRRIVVTSTRQAPAAPATTKPDPMVEARAAAKGNPKLLAAMATPAAAPTLGRNAFAVRGRRMTLETDAPTPP